MDRRHFISNTSFAFSSLPFLNTLFAKLSSDDLPNWIKKLIENNDNGLANLEKYRIIDTNSEHFGGLKDGDDIANPQMTSGFVNGGCIAFLSETSQWYRSEILENKILLAVNYLKKVQHSDGTIDLLSTNFHSTPDTAFIVERLALVYHLLENQTPNNHSKLLDALKPFLINCGKALTVGGIHTPNHRWVVCNALAKLNNIFPNKAYINRAEEWLAEHIDQDEDGQYNEKSTGIYSAIVNKALISVAIALNKPMLLDYVRKNLEMTLFFVHPNGEAVTDASNRQDKGAVANFENYYFSYRYLAILDQNPVFAGMCKLIEEKYFNRIGDLEHILSEKLVWKELPTPQRIPTNYSKYFKHAGIQRIRKENWDATILQNNPNFLTYHKNGAIIQGVRLAASFFGKGQFQSESIENEGDSYILKNKLEGPYYQPIPKKYIDKDGDWAKMPKEKRKQSEIQKLETIVKITENKKGLELEINMQGTDNVPVTLEIIFRNKGEFMGVSQSENEPNSFYFKETEAVYQSAQDKIEFGPGRFEHKALHLRGGMPASGQPTVYLTGFTPFFHKIYIK